MWTVEAPLTFINTYLDHINKGLQDEGNGLKLSQIQRMWLGFCLMGILLTNSICWAKFERMSFKSYKRQAISWMFRHAKLPWDKILTVSVRIILKRFGITEGFLVIDDKDISRSNKGYS